MYGAVDSESAECAYNYTLDDRIEDDAEKGAEEEDDDDEEEENEEDVEENEIFVKDNRATDLGVSATIATTASAAKIIVESAEMTPSGATCVPATPPVAVSDADYAAATPADVATLHLMLDDSSKSKHENLLVGRFISKGCSCTLGPKGQPCYTGFSIEDILKKRNAALALPKNERELIVKAYLLHMNGPSISFDMPSKTVKYTDSQTQWMLQNACVLDTRVQPV